MAGAQGGVRALAGAGQFRCAGPAGNLARRIERPGRRSEAQGASAGRLLHERAFVLLWLTRLLTTIGYQALAVVIGWSINAISGSALDLGFVGLLQFIPAVVLTLLLGHAADRYDRRKIVRHAQSVYAVCAAFVLVVLLV